MNQKEINEAKLEILKKILMRIDKEEPVDKAHMGGIVNYILGLYDALED